ncbi:hypothetical protein [Longimicrobium sp.]|uniref:hypothetical protein n=1 Tax=Longimicrobium sp. TaxID=2029185 RepID=UPI002E381B14|nr:hypothetical protein [Longimicrobium sp.]HEX6037607.1 hypothetical protein [Longimicrobium sp.]
MAKHIPLSDSELHAIEALALDATPGPWEPQVVMDYQTGESARVVVHAAAEDDELRYVVEGAHELAEADQRFIAAMHPDAVLRLVREIRRLRKVQERYDMMCGIVEHLNAFLERRGLVAQAQRFVEVRAQLERIAPDGTELGDGGRAGADRRSTALA